MSHRKLPSPRFSLERAAALILLSASAPVSGVFSFENQIGLAGVHPWEGVCLAIPTPNLSDGTAVTLVEPQSRRILDARVAGRLDGSCVSGGEVPGLIGRHGDSNYRLRIVDGNPRDYDVLVATLLPVSEHAVRDGYVRADLDRDGEDESFRSCLSSEGLHLTVWSGSPLEGERRWHHYHYLGFDLDPSAQDCTKADYESEMPASSRKELQAYVPQMEDVSESNRSFSYDATLIDRASAERVAEHFHAKFGQDESPHVYSIPGQESVYLVSAVKDHRGLEDFGWRFLLVLDEGGGLRTIYRGKGMGDSYSLLPTFFADDDEALILAEIGAEYSWGLEAYALVGKTMRYLGPLDVAAWSGENYVNPLEHSKVTSGEAGYRVQFFSDLTLDPGGIHQWTLPKLKASISFIEDRDRFVLHEDSVGSQACFFLIDETQSQAGDDAEISNDFVYYFDGMVPWLDRRRISYSFQSRFPLKMIAAGHNEDTISGDELRSNAGVVLMAPNGSRKILYGVSTDVDLASEITEFFGLGQSVE